MPPAAWRCRDRCSRRASRRAPAAARAPARTDLAVVPEADHGLAVPKRGALTETEAMGIVVESTLEWIVREVVGAR